MPSGSDPSFTPILPGDLSSVHRLSTLAGWNQTADDWARLMRLNPGGVRVWKDRGEVRASFSVMPYDGERRVGWIGMILVDPAWRGRGIGGAALVAALSQIRERGLDLAGLDATDLGEPVYRRHGFQGIRPMTRWRGRLRSGAEEGAGPEPVFFAPSDEVLEAFDRRVAGVDRSPLLRDLRQGGAGLLALKDASGGLVAYGFVRPGREAWQLGPVVASGESWIPELLRGLVRRLGEGAECLCDVPDGAIPPAFLRAVGMEASRHLQRMTLPLAAGTLCGPGICCATGFEMG
jgi:GNAT superfamily N-acetyltransferase